MPTLARYAHVTQGICGTIPIMMNMKYAECPDRESHPILPYCFTCGQTYGEWHEQRNKEEEGTLMVRLTPREIEIILSVKEFYDVPDSWDADECNDLNAKLHAALSKG